MSVGSEKERVSMASSLVLYLVGRNIPLGHFRNYQSPDTGGPIAGIDYSYRQKNVEREARIIFAALTQDEVVDLVAREWKADLIPAQYRILIRTLADKIKPSNNVSKGLMRLNNRLNGELFRKERVRTDSTIRTDHSGNIYRDHRPINPAVAGAQRAYAAYVRPANYNSLSKRERSRIDRELQEARRNDKR